MFSELSPQEQQRVAQGYMSRLGGKTPADVNKAVQLLLSNNDHAAAAMQLFNTSGVSDPEGRTPNIDMLVANMSKQDGMQDMQEAPMPPKRPATIKQPTTPTPPTKPVELTGEDRVQAAGGPGAVERNTAAQASNTKATETAAPSSKASIVDKLLTALGVGTGAYAAYKMANGMAKPQDAKQMPPEAEVGVDTTGKQVVAQPSKFDRVFGEDIEDAAYRDVTPPKRLPPPAKQIEAPKKQITGPDVTAGRDNVKKADGDVIEAEGETPDGVNDAAPPKRAKAKPTATTAKEKIKPKVKVK